MIDSYADAIGEPEAITAIPIEPFLPDTYCQITTESMYSETVIVSIVDAAGTTVQNNKLASGETLVNKIPGDDQKAQPYTLIVLSQSPLMHTCRTSDFNLDSNGPKYQIELCRMKPLPGSPATGQINITIILQPTDILTP